jgi:hypothetical protein
VVGVDRAKGWLSIDAQEYPYPFVFAEFSRGTDTVSTFQRYADYPPFTDVSGLWWRSLPINWPECPVLIPR